MLLDNHLDELAHGASHFPDFPADSVMQFQRDSAGDAFQLHSFLAPFSLVFPFGQHKHTPNHPGKLSPTPMNIQGKKPSQTSQPTMPENRLKRKKAPPCKAGLGSCQALFSYLGSSGTYSTMSSSLQSKDLHSLSSVCVVTGRLDWSLCTVAWLMPKVTLKV